MRNLILLVTILIVSCKKDDLKLLIFEAGPQDTGSCVATRDGHVWSATASANIGPWSTKKYVGLSFTTFRSGALREYMLIGGMLAKEGVYAVAGFPADTANLLSGATLGVWESDGDLLGAHYQTDSTSTQSQITITKLDTATGILEGEFNELNFVLQNKESSYPKTLKYSGGKFSINLK